VIIFLRETGGDHSIGDGRGLEAFGDQPDAQPDAQQNSHSAIGRPVLAVAVVASVGVRVMPPPSMVPPWRAPRGCVQT
jgi:hypothetical protein